MFLVGVFFGKTMAGYLTKEAEQPEPLLGPRQALCKTLHKAPHLSNADWLSSLFLCPITARD